MRKQILGDVDLLAHLKGVRRSGEGWTAKCPAHEDRQNSLSVHYRDEKWLLKCHAGCGWEAIIAALGIASADLFDRGEVKDPPEQPRNRSTAQSAGLTLEQYAAAKALPATFLRECGLCDVVLAGRHAVRIPYLGVGGEELAPSRRRCQVVPNDRPSQRHRMIRLRTVRTMRTVAC
jgi:putative DNA primase/helicase